MTGTLKGFFLVPTPKNPDTGLWFIFHHEAEGILAFDVTTPYPDMAVRHFAPLMPDAALPDAVLLGGGMQPDSALIVLHANRHAGGDAHVISDDFVFHSFRFRLIPGEPAVLTRADDSPPDPLQLISRDPVALILGFRLWEMDDLERDLRDWQWMLLPAAPAIIFDTPPDARLDKARLTIN